MSAKSLSRSVVALVPQVEASRSYPISPSDPNNFQRPPKHIELCRAPRSDEFSTAPVVEALQQIRRMRGGAQSHLMRCSDDGYYVVKFPNNPQGTRVLFNELLGAHVARLMNLPVPRVSVVSVSPKLIRNSEELVMELRHGRTPCQPGLCVGSRHVGDVGAGSFQTTLDLLPEGEEPLVDNHRAFAGMLVFDQWVCNTDSRQTVFVRDPVSFRFSAHIIDNGHCFGGPEWKFDDAPLRGLFHGSAIYNFIRSFEEFEPWLDRIDRIDLISLRAVANTAPMEWYGGDRESLAKLLYRLDRRRKRLRNLLWETLKKASSAFINVRALRTYKESTESRCFLQFTRRLHRDHHHPAVE